MYMHAVKNLHECDDMAEFMFALALAQSATRDTCVIFIVTFIDIHSALSTKTQTDSDVMCTVPPGSPHLHI